MFLSLNT